MIGLFFLTLVGILFSERFTFTNYYFSYGNGRSMCPTLGSFSITLNSKDVSDLKAGDIVTFIFYDEELQRNLNVEHRIIEKRNNFYLLKGDNNPVSDKWVYKNEIKDKMIYNLNLWGC